MLELIQIAEGKHLDLEARVIVIVSAVRFRSIQRSQIESFQSLACGGECCEPLRSVRVPGARKTELAGERLLIKGQLPGCLFHEAVCDESVVPKFELEVETQWQS